MVVLTLISCLKDAKETIEDIEQRTRCVELLSDFTVNTGDKTYDQQIDEIDLILRNCGEFMTPKIKKMS